MTKCNNAFSYPHPCQAGDTKEEKHSCSLAGRGNEEKTVLFSSVACNAVVRCVQHKGRGSPMVLSQGPTLQCVCVTACYIIVNVRDLPLSSKLKILQNRSKNHF